MCLRLWRMRRRSRVARGVRRLDGRRADHLRRGIEQSSSSSPQPRTGRSGSHRAACQRHPLLKADRRRELRWPFTSLDDSLNLDPGDGSMRLLAGLHNQQVARNPLRYLLGNGALKESNGGMHALRSHHQEIGVVLHRRVD